jgi:hypothetical protein
MIDIQPAKLPPHWVEKLLVLKLRDSGRSDLAYSAPMRELP